MPFCGLRDSSELITSVGTKDCETMFGKSHFVVATAAKLSNDGISWDSERMRFPFVLSRQNSIVKRWQNSCAFVRFDWVKRAFFTTRENINFSLCHSAVKLVQKSQFCCRKYFFSVQKNVDSLWFSFRWNKFTFSSTKFIHSELDNEAPSVQTFYSHLGKSETFFDTLIFSKYRLRSFSAVALRREKERRNRERWRYTNKSIVKPFLSSIFDYYRLLPKTPHSFTILRHSQI